MISGRFTGDNGDDGVGRIAGYDRPGGGHRGGAAMSRSIARQCLAPGTAVPPGEVLVATEVGDPSGGLLACPAAPLVGGTLRRRGVRVSYAPVPRCGDASPSDDGATLFVTSALQRDGTATAIGAGANSTDAVALAAAAIVPASPARG